MSGGSLTPQAFVAKWRGVRQNERQVAQQHFLDLCALLGQPTPMAADPAGAWYTFERGVTKTGASCRLSWLLIRRLQLGGAPVDMVETVQHQHRTHRPCATAQCGG